MAGSASIAAMMMPTFLWGSESEALVKARQESDLIYLTPIRSDGEESSCQAEVWFVADGDDLYIVTASDSWRARAVRKGLHDTRIWIGDLGEWKSTDGKYRSLPQLDMKGSEVLDANERNRILELFGSKYPLQWVLWGARFRDGLADGSRGMFRYRKTA
jgi:hypothetical protein